MDFQKICRLCLEERDSMWQIYGGEKTDLLNKIFSKILQIEISEDDQLPQQICEQCVITITKLDETIRTYRENDDKLRNLLYETGHVQVKDELMEMEPEYLLEPEIYLDKIEQTKEEDIDRLENSNEFTIKDDVSGELLTELNSASSETINQKSDSQNVRPVQERRKGRRKRKDDFPDKPRNGELRCYICRSHSFGNAGELLAHLNEHSGELPYTCAICVHKTVVISNVTSLNVHMRMHANPVPCPHCDSRFSSKVSLGYHTMMQHQELNPDKTPSTCSECGKVFLNAKALRFHMSSHSQPVACEVCGKIFPAKKDLTRHVNRVHVKADRAECHVCHKILGTMNALQNHISIMHSKEQFKCKLCPKIYYSKTSLTNHERQHESNPKYAETMSNQWKQYYTVQGDTKTCNLCGIMLGKVVRSHYIHKHFPQAKRKFRCDPCNLEFRNRTDFEVHMLEHTHGKFLKCPICDKEFAEKRQLVVHMRTKKHKDHPLAQSLDWIRSDLPVPLPTRLAKTEERDAVSAIVPDQDMS